MSQLHMRRADLKNLPPLELPDGYTLREYSTGDEAASRLCCKRLLLNRGVVSALSKC
jgi:hypothetical protein